MYEGVRSSKLKFLKNISVKKSDFLLNSHLGLFQYNRVDSKPFGNTITNQNKRVVADSIKNSLRILTRQLGCGHNGT